MREEEVRQGGGAVSVSGQPTSSLFFKGGQRNTRNFSTLRNKINDVFFFIPFFPCNLLASPVQGGLEIQQRLANRSLLEKCMAQTI